MRKYAMAITLLVVVILTQLANAATVIVYPTFAKTFETYAAVGKNKAWDAYSASTVLDLGNGDIRYYYAYVNEKVLSIISYDTKTDKYTSQVVDVDVANVFRVAATKGMVVVSYFSDKGPAYKIYTPDLQLISGPYICAPYSAPDQSHSNGYIYCAKNATPKVQNFYPVAVSVVPKAMKLSNGEYIYMLSMAVTAIDDYGNVYAGAATKTYTSQPSQTDFSMIANMGYLGQFNQPLPAYIANNGDFSSAAAFGVLSKDTETNTYSEFFIYARDNYGAKAQDIGVSSGTYSTYVVAKEVDSPASNPNFLITVPTVELSPLGDYFLFIAPNDEYNDLLLYKYSTGSGTIAGTYSLSSILSEKQHTIYFENFLEGNDDAEATATMYKSFYLASIPTITPDGHFQYDLVMYNTEDNSPRFGRTLRTLDYITTARILSNGDALYFAVFGNKENPTPPSYIDKFTEFWVTISPPYFAEPPGSTVTVKVSSTVPASLEEVNAPSFVTVQFPQTIDTSPQYATITISNNAPEGNYGLISAKFSANDGTTFTAGIVFELNQVNDPPTTPGPIEVNIDNGTAHISWGASVDPDGDQITYIVHVFDNTADENVLDENTTSTSIDVPVSVGDTYTVQVTATDGNLMSDTASKQFTYTLVMSVSLLDPENATYVDPNAIIRAYYTSNVGATLTIETSPDGSTWSPAQTYNVSGSGTVDLNYVLSPGDNYIRASIAYGSTINYSEVVDAYYLQDSNITMRMIEPSAGQTYYSPNGAPMNITFTATYNTTSDGNGTRTYKIVVTDTNGNQTAVASTTTDEQIYTLQGSYGLPPGDYIAYPVYVNVYGDEVYGSPISFKVVASQNNDNPPSVPLPIHTDNTTDTNVTLSWHASTDPDGDSVTYHVVVATDEQFSNVVFDSTTANTSILATNLYGGKVYYWRVQACDTAGACSAWSPYDSFAVYESTSVDIIEPANNASYVADDSNTAEVALQVSALTNTNDHFELNIYRTGGEINSVQLQGPFDKVFEYNVQLPPGDYNIVAVLSNNDTNENYFIQHTIHVYAAGTVAGPKINLIDPPDGYYEEIDPTVGHTTITSRAYFELPEEGNNYIAIEYKLKWATTWNTVVDSTKEVTPDDNTASLVGNVTLNDGVYLFRAKVVDPDGREWYSQTHTVVLRLQGATSGNNGETQQGGGGGGAGGAPILVPSEVNWTIGSNETKIETIHVNNVGTTPIKVKIWYDGDVEHYILDPPAESSMVIPPGDYNISFKVSGTGATPGTTAKGEIILAPVGSTIRIPVNITIVSGGTGTQATSNINLGSILAPVIVIGALIVAYLIFSGVL